MIQHRKRGRQICDKLRELSVERLDISVLRLSCQALEVMGDLRVYQKAIQQDIRQTKPTLATMSPSLRRRRR